MTLRDVLTAFRAHWRLVLVITLLVTAGTTLYSEWLPDEYEGEAIVSIAPRLDAPTVSADLVTVGAPKYVAFATAPSTLDRISDQIGEDPEDLEDATDITLAADTGDVTIRVHMTTPTRAATTANLFADDLVTFSDQDQLLTASVTAPAAVPSDPSGPPRLLMEGTALLVGVLVGVAIAFVRERGQPRLRSLREVAEVSGFPVVGRIPRSRGNRRGVRRLTDPLVAAAARTLRTNVEREVGSELRGVLVVTSATPGEGKTTTGAVFAMVLARLQLRVLLVDADLHKAELSRRVSASSSSGLAGVLEGREPIQDTFRPGWIEGLWVLTTVPATNAGELLALQFRDFATKARELFDVVIVDTPPLLGADDTVTMATLADGILLVVSVGTLAEAVEEASAALRALRVPVWGVVANRLPRRGPGGAANYRYYARGS
jgi:polysaccharide biosynthesis transport protein